MQIHQTQAPFLKVPTATTSREELPPQKPSALPLDQVRASKEQNSDENLSLIKEVKYLEMGWGRREMEQLLRGGNKDFLILVAESLTVDYIWDNICCVTSVEVVVVFKWNLFFIKLLV